MMSSIFLMTSSKGQLFKYLKMDHKNDLLDENGKSSTLVNNVVKKKYPDVKHLSRKQIFRIVAKFEQYLIIGDRKKDTSIRHRAVKSDENIEKVKTNLRDANQISKECS